MINIIMNGCNGKMGQTITGILKDDKDAKIVAGIDKFDGIKNDYPVFPSLDACDVKADVIIDFSTATAVDALLDYYGKTNLLGISEEMGLAFLAKLESGEIRLYPSREELRKILEEENAIMREISE